MSPLESLKQRARELKRETYALYIGLRDPRVPWYARLLGICVIGYALSPLDLIPDFIPVLGYLDDLILVPLGIALVLKLVPEEVMADSRAKAETLLADGKPTSRVAAAIVIIIWILLAALTITLVAGTITG